MIQIIGHLGRDREMRYTPGGQPTTTFPVAVNRSRHGQDGQRAEETDWFRVVCWSKLAETADQYLQKGARVYVEGRLQIREYTGRDGSKKSATEIIAHDMILLSGKEEQKEPVAAGSAKRRAPESEGWDDVPF